jgi:copper resistance protein D
MLVDGLSAALRAVSFVALFQAAGMALFLTLFGHLLSQSEAGTRRLVVLSAFVAMVLIVAHYLLEAGRMGGELAGVMDSSLQALVLHSPASTALAGRLLGLTLIIVSLRLKGAVSMSLSVVGTLLVIGSFTLMGHTTMQPTRWLLGLLLVVHLLVVAFWFGALVPLYRASSRESAGAVGSVVQAFSALAVWVVPAVLIAGVLLAAFLLKSLANLSTTYGQLLLVKLAAFAVLMGLAALNKWRLGPALARGDSRASIAFRRSLAAEYVLIVGVLSVTAVLTSFYSPD